MYTSGTMYILIVVLLSILGLNSSLIPEIFENQDISSYGFRYVSNDGADNSECLLNQSYPVDSSLPSTYACASLGYAILGTNETSGAPHNIIVLVYPGLYDLGEKGIELRSSRNVIVSRVPGEEKDVVFKCFEYTDDDFNNFFVYQSTEIAFIGVIFERCGAFSTPLVITEVTTVFIANCAFRNNRNSGLALYQTDNFWIGNSMFHDNNASSKYQTISINNFNPGNVRLAGGITVFWTENATRLTGVITDCRFYRNTASVNELNSGERPPLYLPRGSGGAISVTFFSAVESTLTIRNCSMSYNNAQYYGGGMYLGFTSRSVSNNVVISGSSFKYNTAANGTGGAISMNTFENSNRNTLAVFNSNFEENVAVFSGGGACSVAIQDNIVSDDLVLLENVASFSGSNFTRNTALPGGSAVQLISNARVDQFSATVNFTNCLFAGNNATSGGSVLSFRMPISLAGVNMFRENTGGAVALFRSRMDVQGNATFERNTADRGAGILMQDLSLIQLFSGSVLSFIANDATTFGGAIASVSVSTDSFLFFNTRCFIQYEVTTQFIYAEPPELWNATVMFTNNTAGSEGAALYVSNLELCTYTNRSFTPRGTAFENSGTAFENSIFQVNSTFKFRGNRVTNSEQKSFVSVESLATAPSRLAVFVVSEDVLTKEIGAAPSRVVLLNVSAYDQADNSLAAVWSIEDTVEENTTETAVAYFDAPRGGVLHRYSVPGLTEAENASMNCSEGIKRVVNFLLIDVNGGSVENEPPVNITVTVNCCYPGYEFRYDNITGLTICEHLHLGGVILRPDFNKTYVYARPQIYIADREGTLVYAVMPPPFQKCTREQAQSGCLFKFDDPDAQCSDNRTDFMCGVCRNGTNVDLTLQKCRECSDGDAAIVAIIVTLFVVVSVLVLLFNIGVPNDLKGCLFFVQVVGFVYSYSEGNTVTWDFHISRIFGFNLYLPLCPSPGYDALSTALYGFTLSFFAMSTVIVYIICARFIRALSQRSSFDGIWLLSIITYKYTADTCFSVLRCVKVSGEGVRGEFRYYYDGSITCFQPGKHLAPALFSIILVVFVVILFPIAIFVISYRRYKRTYVFTDVLTDGIKVSCRWWSGYDLYRRLLFITVVFVFNYINPDYIQIALLFTSLVVFVIFARSKPYTSTRSNVIEGLVLLDLILITALFLNRHESTQIGRELRLVAVILLLLPFITVFLYIATKLWIIIWHNVLPASVKTRCMGQVNRLKPNVQTSSSEEKSAITNLTEHTVIDDEGFSRTEYSRFREELLADVDNNTET